MFPISFSPLLLGFVACLFLLVRLILHRTALIYVVTKWLHWIEDAIHVHQTFKVPELNENLQENQFYRKVFTYLNSLASMEDSDFTNLLSGKKPNDIVLSLDDNQTLCDTFLGARVSWKNQVERAENYHSKRSLLLTMKKKDKRRILRPYIQHILNTISGESRELKLHMITPTNKQSQSHQQNNGTWRSVQFMHPATFDTIAIDSDLKNKVKYDLESFLKSKHYYHRLGRVWKRSYLLYGPSGTGKSSFVAAMAKFLSYDVYDLDLSQVSDDSHLKMLLLQTSNKSVILIEDLDRFVKEKLTMVSLSGVLSFMDGIVSSCFGDEKIMVFTMNSKEEIDPTFLRPGRIDVHIYFRMCNFNSFKSLATSYLRIKDHKLFPQVEEIFQSGATMSPAEIGEIMMLNRSSPSRALKSVITALQTNNGGDGGRRRMTTETGGSSREEEESGGAAFWKDKDGISVAKEFRKLYGLFRMKSSKKSGPLDHSLEVIEER